MIMVEHFTKWIELAALPAKDAHWTASVFMDRVIGRFGAPAEVVTDRGGEFEKEFSDLLQRCMIDHRFTSPEHPQADGLAERIVQTCKRALRKISVEKGSVAAWDDELPWIALGYRCSVQESTGYSPYFLLYGVHPVVPPAVWEKFRPVVNFETNPDRVADVLRDRAKAMRRACAAAGHNLQIAQHRDTLRYAKVRSGGYIPKLFRYSVGDYVYLRTANDPYTLDAKSRPTILRVKKVNGDGSLQVQGSCGGVVTVHADRCAPCHLQIIDGKIDHTRSRPSAHAPCEVCGMPDKGEVMVLCDKCGKGWHTFCMEPPLDVVPEGEFVCPLCTGEWDQRQQAGVPVGRGRKGLQKEAGPSVEQKKEAAACKALEGRIRVLHSLDDKGEPVILYGKLKYLGEEAWPRCLEVVYSDGSTRRLDSKGAARGLQDKGYALPPEISIEGETRVVGAGMAMVKKNPEEWPDQFEMYDGGDVQRVLRMLMPGQWQGAMCTRMCSSLPGTATYLEYVRQRQKEPSPAAALKLLRKVVDLRMASCLVDPWADMLPDEASLWAEAGLKVLRNTAREEEGWDFSGSPTQPTWYRKVRARKGLGFVVGFPWARLCDLYLPLAAGLAVEGVAARVPAAWLAHAPPARSAWLDGLRAQMRLLVVMGSQGLVATTQAEVWLCVFRDDWVRSRLTKPEYRSNESSCWVF